jgi:hypothetical protein
MATQEQSTAIVCRDSAAISRYLGIRGLRLSAILAARDGYYAVIADSAGETPRYLLPLLVQRDSVSLLFERPREIGEYDPSSVVWFSLDLRRPDGRVDGLLVSWDLGGEGRGGTTIFSLIRGKLIGTFQDVPGTCTPARLVDVNSDGRVELLTYPEERGSCTDVCLLTIERHFDTPPAWVEVRRWTGTTWEPAGEGLSSFYAHLAEKYDQIRRWLSGEWGPDSELCRGVPWVEAGIPFAKWASRAREIASRR